MIRLKIKISVIVTLISFLSCSDKRQLTVNEFSDFIKQGLDKFTNTESISGVKYSVFIEPPELMAIRSCSPEDLNGEEFKESLNTYKKSVYCSFTIKDISNSLKVKQLVYSKPDYFKLVGFANTELQRNFKLIVDNETIYCTVCHMEPPSSINPELRIAVAFDYDAIKLYGKDSHGCEIVFQDEIFNNGIIKFSFDSKDLRSWPELKI